MGGVSLSMPTLRAAFIQAKYVTVSCTHSHNPALRLCLLGAFLVLSACEQGSFDPKRDVGGWQQSVTLVQMTAQDPTNPAVEAAKASIGQTQTSDPFCLVAQSVSGDTLESRLTDIAVLGPEWKLGTITMDNGKVSATATGPLGKITYAGQLTSKLSDITMTIVPDNASPGDPAQSQPTTIQRTRAEHIGPCTSDMVTMGQ
jgi:hypothetical protein